MSTAVAYDPNDATQASFLSALALGEVGTTGGYSTGFGGVDTSSDPTDAYGFPQFGGGSTSAGPTHAAGEYQFEPGTWDSIAQQYNLNFQNPSDQNAGAWYEAQQAYSAATGGQSLESALQNGDYSSVQSALASVWPSVNGSGGNPAGLAGALSSGTGASISTGGAATAPASGSSSSSGGGIIGAVEDFFVRGGLIIAGGLIVLVALWQLLSNTGAVPSPGDAVHAAGKVGATALAAV